MCCLAALHVRGKQRILFLKKKVYRGIADNKKRKKKKKTCKANGKEQKKKKKKKKKKKHMGGKETTQPQQLCSHIFQQSFLK